MIVRAGVTPQARDRARARPGSTCRKVLGLVLNDAGDTAAATATATAATATSPASEIRGPGHAAVQPARLDAEPDGLRRRAGADLRIGRARRGRPGHAGPRGQPLEDRCSSRWSASCASTTTTSTTSRWCTRTASSSCACCRPRAPRRSCWRRSTSSLPGLMIGNGIFVSALFVFLVAILGWRLLFNQRQRLDEAAGARAVRRHRRDRAQGRAPDPRSARVRLPGHRLHRRRRVADRRAHRQSGDRRHAGGHRPR